MILLQISSTTVFLWDIWLIELYWTYSPQLVWLPHCLILSFFHIALLYSPKLFSTWTALTFLKKLSHLLLLVFLFTLPLIPLLWPSFNNSGGGVSRDLDDLELFYLLLILVITHHIHSPIFHLAILFSFKKQTLSQHGHTQIFWRCGHEWLWQHWVI